MSVMNPEGSIEVHVGPRGFSVVSAESDGTNVRFSTDEPRTLNPITLPRGPQGIQGVPGDPGEARIRVDESSGYRVFLWDAQTATEQLVYGDTGVRDLGDGRLVRRVLNTVELEGSIDGLPSGFAPAMAQPGTVHKTYTTAQAWPETLPGTQVTAPLPLTGLEGYAAAAAGGYPGTAEEWLNMAYRVVLPPAGSTGQVLTRTTEGSSWQTPASPKPGAWQAITLDPTWGVVTGSPQVRDAWGTVELIGLIKYTGPTTNAGPFAPDAVRIGVMPPALAPEANYDIPIVTYDPETPEALPKQARLNVTPQGVVQLLGFGYGIQVKAGVTQANLTSVRYAIRNSSAA